VTDIAGVPWHILCQPDAEPPWLFFWQVQKVMGVFVVYELGEWASPKNPRIIPPKNVFLSKPFPKTNYNSDTH